MKNPTTNGRLFAAFSILKSKKKHSAPNQVGRDKEEPISLKEIWPENVQKLWIPKSLTEKIVFENDLLSELYRDIYSIFSPQQLEDYVLSQICSHCPIIQNIISEKSSIDKLVDPK